MPPSFDTRDAAPSQMVWEVFSSGYGRIVGSPRVTNTAQTTQRKVTYSLVGYMGLNLETQEIPQIFIHSLLERNWENLMQTRRNCPRKLSVKNVSTLPMYLKHIRDRS